jgi:anti-sigma-K factor RskA
MSKVTLSELTIAFFDLLEAEGRAFRRTSERFMAEQRQAMKQAAQQTVWASALVWLSVVLALGALGVTAWALYLALGTVLSPVQSALGVSLFLLLFSLFFAGWAQKLFRSREDSESDQPGERSDS